MLDAKQITGVIGTFLSTLGGYLDIIEPIVGIVVTIVVGTLTALYTYERWRKLRSERKSKQERSN